MILNKYMATLTLFLLLPLLFFPAKPTKLESDHLGHISILVSESGLNFAKNLLIGKAISTMIPLQLPDIEKKVRIPLVGKVQMGLSDIQIYAVDVEESWIKTVENGGIVLGITGATADLSMNWSYTYTALFIEISDRGDASVKVEGMDIRIAVSLVEHNGSLRMAAMESYCKVKSINIEVDGGASWLYQGVIDAFQKKIISAVENTVSKKIRENMEKLDSLLQSIPKEKQIDESASVDLTFTDNPVFGDSSVRVGINGLFKTNNGVKVSKYNVKGSRPPFFFDGLNRMVKISLEEEVFNSATLVYFNAERMHFVIDQTENRSILDTADWKLIIPELYNRYPNDKMKLEMSVTSPPAVVINENGIDATIHLDTTIDILDAGEVIPVACLSSVLNVACSAEISKNNIVGSLKLVGFNASAKWSKVGDLHADSVQEATSIVLEAAFFPYVNVRLKRGFPLPIPNRFAIKGTEIVYADTQVMVCSDIAYT